MTTLMVHSSNTNHSCTKKPIWCKKTINPDMLWIQTSSIKKFSRINNAIPPRRDPNNKSSAQTSHMTKKSKKHY